MSKRILKQDTNGNDMAQLMGIHILNSIEVISKHMHKPRIARFTFCKNCQRNKNFLIKNLICSQQSFLDSFSLFQIDRHGEPCST